MRCTLGTTQGVRHSKNARNTKNNCQSGERGNDMLLTYLLLRLAPTLAIAFRRDPNPQPQILRAAV